MKVIRPIEITPAKILSSTATEAYTVWSSASTYNAGDRVIYSETIYESLIASNLNKQPDINKTSWLDIVPSNKTAMFDNQVNTQTVGTTSLNVVFQPGSPFNSIAFLNLQGSMINVKVKDSPTGSIVYEQNASLDGSIITDWYTYFFEDFDIKTEVTFQNIPTYSSGVVDVTVTAGTGAMVAIGSCSVGNLIDLGGTQYGMGYGIRDYSIKETDDFGNTVFVERTFSKRLSPNIFVENSRMNYVTKTLEKLRATPTVFISTDDPRFDGTITLGFIRDWNIEISYPEHSMLSMEIEGLI